MADKTNFDRVREFHDAFGVENKREADWPDDKTVALRLSLLDEELDELRAAISNDDIVAVGDALGDILYVAYGAGLSFGIDLDRVFAEIHRSNMSKLGLDGNPVRREDGKVLKGPKYSPPNLRFIVDETTVDTAEG